MFVAVDDTDSPKWMCTTFLATELINALRDLDLIGLPRLVRLNPAVPWKTRGNGAICLRFGEGRGTKREVGSVGDSIVYSFPEMAQEVDAHEIMERCAGVVSAWAQPDDSDPGLVVSSAQPSEELYLSAVREIVDKEEARKLLDQAGALVAEWGRGRGIVGAGAAMAWRPYDRTYEILTYRSKERWGKPRQVNLEGVSLLDQDFPSTFNNFDKEKNRPAIVPHSSCPVLYGIRGDSALELIKAKESIHSEKVDRSLLFISNQGTDDHVIRRWSELRPNSSYEIVGRVVSRPTTRSGGHVIFKLLAERNGEEVECVAYEPSKGFRDVVRGLRLGDQIKVLGELREEPRSLNIEKIQVLALAESLVKVANPLCPSCGKRMKSSGTHQGYRCRPCGKKTIEAEMVIEERKLSLGWYEPPVCSRRHLSMPLKRMQRYGPGIV